MPEQPYELIPTLLVGSCNCNNLTVGTLLLVNMLSPKLRYCQDEATYLPPESLAHETSFTAKEKS